MQPFAGNDLVTSALSFAVQRLIHCPLGKTSGNFELSSRHTKVQASALQTLADVLNLGKYLILSFI